MWGGRRSIRSDQIRSNQTVEKQAVHQSRSSQRRVDRSLGRSIPAPPQQQQRPRTQRRVVEPPLEEEGHDAAPPKLGRQVEEAPVVVCWQGQGKNEGGCGGGGGGGALFLSFFRVCGVRTHDPRHGTHRPLASRCQQVELKPPPPQTEREKAAFSSYARRALSASVYPFVSFVGGWLAVGWSGGASDVFDFLF